MERPLNTRFFSLTHLTLWALTLAGRVISQAQVINPIPTNPGPYLGPVAVNFIEPQSDGKIVLAGDFGLFSGLDQEPIIRLNADGSFDETFHPAQLPIDASYSQPVNALLALPDNKLLVGLASTNGIARLNADGTLDATFHMDPVQNAGSYYLAVSGIARQNDGKIIATGYFTHVGTNVANGIVRLNPDGSFDPTFPSFTMGTNLANSFSLLPQPGGKIVVTGAFDAVNGVPYRYLARLNLDGTVDQTLVNNTDFSLYNGLFDIQTDGKMIVGGALGLMRLNADGAVDYRFNPGLGISGTNRYLISARSLPSGDLLICGNFDKYDNQWRRSVARIHEDGSLDSNFDARLTKTAWARFPEITVRLAKILPDNSFYIAGSFTDVQGKSMTGLARFKANGDLDETFVPFQPALRGASVTSDGFYQFHVIGEKWRPYAVEVSNDLKTWQPLRNLMITDLPLYFIDPRQLSGQSFYRIISL